MQKDSIKKAAQDLLADPLSAVTRTAKKSMFVCASLCLLIGHTGILPEEATILGFKFPGLTPTLISWLLLILLFYSYTTFVIHLISDFLRHKIILDRYSLAVALDVHDACSSPPNEEDDYHEQEFCEVTGYKERAVSPSIAKATNNAKIALEFIFPILFGLYSLIYFCCRFP